MVLGKTSMVLDHMQDSARNDKPCAASGRAHAPAPASYIASALELIVLHREQLYIRLPGNNTPNDITM